MNFYEKTGKMALGTRLRRLSEAITEDVGKIYQLYDVGLQPRWFPVFFVLSQGNEKTITEIALEIGHTHVSVSQIVKDMLKNEFVVEKRDRNDGRKNVIGLSEKGKTAAEKIKDQYIDVGKAIDKAMAETRNDLWKAIEEWEHLLAQKSLLRRVQEQRKERESAKVRIVEYNPMYKNAFKSLNEEWITTYFKMEESDYKALNHPEKYILDGGGYIFMALYNDEAVGTCAMIKMDEETFELAKMAVAPNTQGKNIGWLLGQAIIERAKEYGTKKLYLESNTILKPAISLYYKLGFKKVTNRETPYERCNIQMELELEYVLFP